jgi:hypothetical protein
LPPEAFSEELAPVIAELGLEDNCRRLAMEGWTVVEKGAVPEFNARLRLKILELSRGTAAAIHRIAIPMPTRSVRCAARSRSNVRPARGRASAVSSTTSCAQTSTIRSAE